MAFVYQDQENQIHNLQRGKGDFNGKTSVTQIIKQRTVLGTINSNNERLAARNKKLPLQKNASRIPAPKSTLRAFTIHEDKVPVVKKEENKHDGVNNSKEQINSVIEQLPKYQEIKSKRPPLKEVNTLATITDGRKKVEQSLYASPMSLEKSSDPSLTTITSDRNPIKLLFDIDLYSKEILNYLKELELRCRPKPNYMRRQPDVTYGMRTILVDWLVEVGEEYKLQTQTLYLAISFIDRFLSLMSVVRAKLQLLGTAAMFVASKCEEIYPPEVSEFVYITDDTYTKKQVLRMEYLILKVLEFEVSRPTAITFITHFCALCCVPEKAMYLAMYLSELVLLEGDPYLQYADSIIACSSIAVARHCLDYDDVWPLAYKEITGYGLSQLAPCIENLNTTHEKAASLQQQAINTKYSVNKYMNVSKITASPFGVSEYILQMKELDLNSNSG